jgi:hypothetical protein
MANAQHAVTARMAIAAMGAHFAGTANDNNANRSPFAWPTTARRAGR